jgi:hypothetical protein
VPGNYARLFSTYTDEQLLELASQRDTLVGAGREALDHEMKRRGFDPSELLAEISQISAAGQQENTQVNAISRFFLRAEHWQIFLLSFCLSFIGFMAFDMNLTNNAHHGSSGISIPMIIFLVLTMLSMYSLIAWLGSLGSFLSRIVHPSLNLKTRFFSFSLIFASVYFIFFMLFFLATDSRLFLFVAPFHLLATFCMFYLIYFVSKALVMAEAARPVSFYDHAGPFFLLWMFPLGVWVIQPRINRLFQARAASTI